MVKNIMEALVHASEKAANIARLCRHNENLFPLLTEEKSAEESNPRFVKDFKTLADVLIQQTIRYEIGNLVCIVFEKKVDFYLHFNGFPFICLLFYKITINSNKLKNYFLKQIIRVM